MEAAGRTSPGLPWLGATRPTPRENRKAENSVGRAHPTHAITGAPEVGATPPTPRENWQAEDARIEAAPPTPESPKAVGDVPPTYGEERVEPRITACARAPAAELGRAHV